MLTKLPEKPREITKISDCTDQQRKFIHALCSPDIVEVPRRERFKWAAKHAGYSETTPISQIVSPIQHLIVDATERVLAFASIEAVWTMREALDGEVDSFTKIRLEAAKDILDRSVGKKDRNQGNFGNTPPLAVLILPAKQVREAIDVECEDVPTS